MAPTEPIDPTLPVREILEAHPEVRPVLARYAIDTCCGGEHPLVEACAAKNVPLADVIREIAEQSRPVSLVTPMMSIREVRRRYPSSIPVLERHGLAECGGDEGPEEPLGWFATVHRIALDALMAEVNAAARRDLAAAPPPARPAAAARALPFSPLFIIGSLVLSLTLGASTGMMNLLRIAGGGDVPNSHRQIHAHAQILGFAALFLMGISLHALPRILGVGGKPPAAIRTIFWTMFGGVVLRNAGQPFGFFAFGRLLSLASAGLEIAGGLMFALAIIRLVRRAPAGKYSRRDPLHLFLRSGTAFFLVSLAFVGAQGIWLAGHRETATPFDLTEPFYFAALYGFLLAWIFGFGNRVVSLFLGIGAARRGSAEAAFILQIAGVLLFTSGFVPGISSSMSVAMRDAGTAAASLAAAVFLAGGGFLWRRAAGPKLDVPGAPGAAIRIALGALGLWAILELGGIVVARTTNFPAQNPWWNDAARHLFTIGFLTLMIVGMSFRILPVFSGRRLWSPRLAVVTYALIVLGVVMRLLQYPAAFRPTLYQAGSWMGVPVVAALVLFVVNLVQTMRRGGAPATRPGLPVFAPSNARSEPSARL